MKQLLLSAALLVVWSIAIGPAHAQAPKKPDAKEVLPLPREFPDGKDVLPFPREFPRVTTVPPIRIVPSSEFGRRNVWESYSVNRRGQFVPNPAANPGVYWYPATPAHGFYMPHVAD